MKKQSPQQKSGFQCGYRCFVFFGLGGGGGGGLGLLGKQENMWKGQKF